MQSRLRLTLEMTPYIMRGFVTNLNMGSIRGIFKGSVRFRKLAIVVSGIAKYLQLPTVPVFQYVQSVSRNVLELLL